MKLLAELREGLGISWDAIRANKMRSGLTTLGIIIGIVTVTIMGAAITGLDRAFLKSISSLGADVFYVERRNWINKTQDDWLKGWKRRPVTVAEAKALAGQLTLAAAVAPVVNGRASVEYKNKSAAIVWIVGTTEDYRLTSGVDVSDGRFLSVIDAAGGRPVCILGTQIATNLFQSESPLGHKVKLGGQSFEVVGVLEKQGTFLGFRSLDNRVIIPLKQFIALVWHNPDVQVQVKARHLSQLEEAREELRCAMRRVRRLAPNQPDDFGINQQDQIVKAFHRDTAVIALTGLCITALSLFVGGIGIMNIMFVSVAERTHEIGIRKAIGAKRRTILLQFLVEAACICLVGGLIGLGIARLLIFGIQEFLPSVMSPAIVGAALLVSLATGVVSGFLPAWRAARMKPVDALRSE
ncbi:MAG TPA: ABC transporter permease [Verrucomicrobiae bacterium]|nr:ABC transporter permease [Verrucomicrobiae bacterium]